MLQFGEPTNADELALNHVDIFSEVLRRTKV